MNRLLFRRSSQELERKSDPAEEHITSDRTFADKPSLTWAERWRMIWTTKKPTKTGWYWYRGGGDGQTEKVLHFIDDDGDGLYLATSDDLALTDLAGEWAGPVEPPLSGQSR